MKSILALVFLQTYMASADPKGYQLKEPIQPLPEISFSEIDTEKILLGKKLFHDVKLSHNNTISCSSCHDLQHGGVDGKAKSIGINGTLGDINAPTVFNSGFNFRQFWNGRAKNLEEQIEGPVQNPKEMDSAWDEVLVKLKKDSQYPSSFSKLYSNGITKENIEDAIATFERALVTPNARFDRYLRGDSDALSDIEKNGYQRFKSFGCVACHQGMNVGGNMYQTMGVMGNYFKDRGTPITDADLGKYVLTKEEADKHVFRVPSLRNVELTAPYFHDGSAKTLEDAINIMAKYQLGRKLTKEEVHSIAAFLKTLTGETPNILKGNRTHGESK